MVNKKIAVYGLIIGTYCAISLLLGSFSFGSIQIRIAEVLLVFCLYDKKYIMPVTIGCFLTNLLGLFYGLNPLALDLIVGSFATLLSGLAVYYFRNIRVLNFPFLSLFSPVIINGVFIGVELSFYFPINIFLLCIYVSLGELLSVLILGGLLYKPIGKIIKQYME